LFILDGAKRSMCLGNKKYFVRSTWTKLIGLWLSSMLRKKRFGTLMLFSQFSLLLISFICKIGIMTLSNGTEANTFMRCYATSKMKPKKRVLTSTKKIGLLLLTTLFRSKTMVTIAASSSACLQTF
jgi:hypothetical protein